MYKVVKDFKDKDGQFYRKGESYPTTKQTTTRIKTLSSTDNAYGQIFIKKNETPKVK
jgi:hypothetical protein